MQLFINLAEERHFGRAANRSHISASAATRALQRLESETGTRLLERDNRSVHLTRSGQEFLAYARQAVQGWRGILAGLSEYQQAPKGALRLYCSVTATYALLASILPQVRQRYPGIEIHLNTGDQALAVARVEDGIEDLAIAAHPGQLADKLCFQSLAESPLVCIAPVIDCQLRSVLNVEAEPDWRSLPFIIAEGGLARTRLEQWFEQRRIDPQVYAYVSGHEAIVSLVALGFGLGVVPQLVLESSALRDQLQVLPYGPALKPFNIGLVARKERLHDPVVRVVWDLAGNYEYAGAGFEGDLPSTAISSKR